MTTSKLLPTPESKNSEGYAKLDDSLKSLFIAVEEVKEIDKTTWY
jgi:hypothetical protein